MKFQLPEKITTYGGSRDKWVRIIDRPRLEHDECGRVVLHIDRTIVCQEPADYIMLELKIPEYNKGEE